MSDHSLINLHENFFEDYYFGKKKQKRWKRGPVPSTHLQFISKGRESAYSMEKTLYGLNSEDSTEKALSHWQLLEAL